MRIIEILGPSCADCLRLELAAAQAVRQAGVEAEIKKVADDRRIRRYGVVDPPGLVIDGVLASTGRVPKVSEIAGWLRAA